jgi:ribosomal protein S18 acetylase RimI-like enzyme
LREVSNTPDIAIVEAGSERLHEVKPIWAMMFDHDTSVAAGLGELVSFRSAADAWRRRRDAFASWLSAGDAFMLIAEKEGRPVGFALVRLCEGAISFESDDRIGELESIGVVPDLRGRGIGSRLMDEVDRRLAAMGIGFLSLSVAEGNDDALRFYERRGMRRSQVRCLGRIKAGAREGR